MWTSHRSDVRREVIRLLIPASFRISAICLWICLNRKCVATNPDVSRSMSPADVARRAKGTVTKTIEMNFLPDVLVPCEECHGKRYNRETLEVRFRGKSIADILDMTINMAVEFFENIPSILSKVKVLQDVGLGYIKLGQPSTTLSGGESQRVKLATELAKKDTGKTLYVLDEPTTGLHFEDIRVLLGVLNKLWIRVIRSSSSSITSMSSNVPTI